MVEFLVLQLPTWTYTLSPHSHEETTKGLDSYQNYGVSFNKPLYQIRGVPVRLTKSHEKFTKLTTLLGASSLSERQQRAI